MPHINTPVVLDLPTPLTRRRRRVRIAALLLFGLWTVAVTLLLWPAKRSATTSTDIVPTLSVGAAIIAEPSTATSLPIHVTPAELVPTDAWVRIASLPMLAFLSDGRQIAPGLWSVPLAALPKLKITAPSGHGIRSIVGIALMSADGRVLAETQSVLAIMPARFLLARDYAAVAAPEGVEATARSQPQSTGVQCASVLPVADFSYEQVASARKLVEKGDSALSEGAVTVAQSFYQRAAQMGWSGAAFALAATYDPHELARWPLGPKGNLKLARCWYSRALQLAGTEAAFYLQRLDPAPKYDRKANWFPYAAAP